MKVELGKRIQEARKRRGVQQKALADAIGWGDRQTVSDVEHGKREVKAWELYKIAEFLHIGMNDLLPSATLPKREPYVLWRQKPEEAKLQEGRFLQQCDNYVRLEQLLQSPDEQKILDPEELPKRAINLSVFTSEEASNLAEVYRDRMNLGDFPATQLVDVLEDRYGIKFIIDQEDGAEHSAACSRSEKGCFILLNGKESESRQHFSIAHELFHLITWDADMLASIEKDPKLHEKNESLANDFAASLLIPQEKLRIELAKICSHNAITGVEVVVLAEKFRVSKAALLLRLRKMGLLQEKEYKKIQSTLDQVRYSLESQSHYRNIARQFRSKFVRLVYLAYERAKLSRAKAAKLLNVPLADLSNTFVDFGLLELDSARL